MRVYCRMKHGATKSNSEDRVLINNSILSDGVFFTEINSGNDPVVFAIADGVGGNPGGFLAAHMAVEGLMANTLPCNIDDAGVLQLIKNINNRIIEKSTYEGIYPKMATTLSGICLFQDKYYLFHVGNTRVYAWDDPYLTQLTVDHTYVKELRMLGLTEEEIRKNPKSSEINSCLGNGDPQTANRLYVKDVTDEIGSARMVILTTDGIHDFISNESLENSLTRITDIPTYLKDALAYAYSKGSRDDLSMVIVEMDDDTQRQEAF